MSKKTAQYRKLMDRHRKLSVDEQRLWKTLSKKEKEEVYDQIRSDADRFQRKAKPKPPRAAVHGDLYEKDGSMITIDDSECQRLWVRVGPVFGGSKIHKQFGLWINYQEKILESPMTGPVLISPSTWRRMKKDIDIVFEGFDGRKKKGVSVEENNR